MEEKMLIMLDELTSVMGTGHALTPHCVWAFGTVVARTLRIFL